jgi:hypothetical protein
MLSEDNFPCTSLHGANPHISVSMPIQGLGPSFMVALPGNDGSFRMLGIFAIGKFLQIVMHFLRSPSSLKCAFMSRCLIFFISPSSIQSLLHRLIVTAVFKVAWARFKSSTSLQRSSTERFLFHSRAETMDRTVRRRKERSSERTSDLKDGWNRRQIIDSGRRPLLCAYEELPTWYKESENEYIRHGYRPELQSTWACLSSWTYVHNESFNIYSHLIAAISFLVGLILMDRLIVWRFPAATIVDRAVFAFFVSAGIGAFTLSFLYHTFICHSLRFSNLWLQLDFVGIVTLMLGGFVSGIYVGFYCDPALQKLYWSMVSTAVCL